MIGNDIVDIVQARKESNWQRKGFLQKIFTANEQLLIAQSTTPEITVWLLWSMKEAAYKIYNRQTTIRAFIPTKLECCLLSDNLTTKTGRVLCFGTMYYTKSTVMNDVIHTIAVSYLKDLNNIIEIENKNIIKDKYGIPYLSTAILQDVSISHHGKFEKVVVICN